MLELGDWKSEETKEMLMLLTGAVLLGALLARFFKVYILVPASYLILVLLIATSRAPIEIGMCLAALQVGYVVGLVLFQRHISTRVGHGMVDTIPSRSFRIR